MSVVGKGSSGEIIIVQKNGKNYARKTISNTPNGLNGFLEALFLCGNDNEYIGTAEFIDFDDHQRKLYLYSEIASANASVFRRKNISIELNQMKKLTLHLLRGLEYIHSFDIIHRDIKPDNVLLYENDKGITLRIIDFGMSVQCSSIKGDAYTIYYKPPEVWDGKEYDEKADIWALGCTLYEIYHQEVLFPIKNVKKRSKIFEERLKSLEASKDEFDIFLLKMLKLNPTEREDISTLLNCFGEKSLFEDRKNISVENISQKLFEVLEEEYPQHIHNKTVSEIVALKISGNSISPQLLSQLSQESLYQFEKKLILLCRNSFLNREEGND